MHTVEQNLRPGMWPLFRIWAGIGLQSFGGGASTTFLIQTAFVENHKWLTMEEFTHLWNLCVFTPGINLIALTILIGRKLGGAAGVFYSLTGMLLPSSLITCLLTAGFLEVEHAPVVQAALKGVIPATAGIMLVVGVRFALPLVKAASKEGIVSLAINSAITLACALAIIVLQLPVIIVLPSAALLGMVLFTSWREHSPASSQEEGE